MGKFAGAVCLLALPLTALAADRITLKNGNSYNGHFVSGTSRQIVFTDENGARRTFDVRDVNTIAFDSGTSSANTTWGETSRRDRTVNSANRADRAETVRQTYVIPASAEIQVRVNENIDSSTATEGRTYSAEVNQDVKAEDGGVAIPRGAQADLVIREIKEGGTVTSPQLVLDLQSVRIDGRRYLISTEDLTQSDSAGIGRNRRTAEMLGGGAALGGLLGAIAGGGKGAVIGAVAGAAAGGAVQVLTKGDRVRVPAETVLKFDLDEPVRLELIR
jgi:hypothetical protein